MQEQLATLGISLILFVPTQAPSMGNSSEPILGLDLKDKPTGAKPICSLLQVPAVFFNTLRWLKTICASYGPLCCEKRKGLQKSAFWPVRNLTPSFLFPSSNPRLDLVLSNMACLCLCAHSTIALNIITVEQINPPTVISETRRNPRGKLFPATASSLKEQEHCNWNEHQVREP